ncbi:RNA polymerase sigma factor [Haloferula sp. BvORR071]|uniref:RNA polymerase sigma factor n=1 Tax=Haloferula sp. BvORR071 TaxID=1396141 RepID=UPI00069746B4|nr:RNA polymerase sigma factor [Haloferula sp. BvORR071]
MESSDPELMARLATGDDLALNTLMDRWGQRVSAFLFRMTGNRETSLDLAQETFVKLYQARDRYRSNGTFSTYLFAIASNLARNHARWKARHPTLSIDGPQGETGCCAEEAVDPGRSPEEVASASEKSAAVDKAFQKLPDDLREAMSLFIYEGMGYSDIAALSGCSPKAIETRIYRARQILKEQLKDFL